VSDWKECRNYENCGGWLDTVQEREEGICESCSREQHELSQETEIATLRTQLAASEARAERLAGALDWISRRLFVRSWGGTLGAPSDWRVAGDHWHTTQRMKGPALLDAVEFAALAEGEAGK